METVKFIDLFAGIGGLRLGFENAFNKVGIATECVMTSEIKPFANKSLKDNFKDYNNVGDITKVDNKVIPDFNFLLAGFPCQPFSAGGKRFGFEDTTRGTLFFEIERILKDKRPYGFILENVEGLIKHDLQNKNDNIGRTLSVILEHLSRLKYKVTWELLDSKDFGLPQTRKRVFIIGTLSNKVLINDFEPRYQVLETVLEKGLPSMTDKMTTLLLKHFDINDLKGKKIKDKRGGDNNIHSWDIELKGPVSRVQIQLLNELFKERRKKAWAGEIGIKWMDGMPLTTAQISTFFETENLEELLNDLVVKGYLRFEHPKKFVEEQTESGTKTYRVPDTTKPKGFNIVTGKLSFGINNILDPFQIAPTLVATDMSKIAVPDGQGLRRITIREGLRMFGYPEDFNLLLSKNHAFDLLGNTVAVPVVEWVASKLVDEFKDSKASKSKILEKDLL